MPSLPLRPAVASYVSDFLKPDMLHVYRQISGLKAVEPWVLTHKLENTERFPFPKKRIIVLPKPSLRWWRRWVHRNIKDTPWQIYGWELRRMLLELTRAQAKVVHIYFGHIAIHLLPLIKACPHPVVVSYHGADAGIDADKPRHRAAMQEVFAAATQIQCRSQSLVDDLIKLGCDPAKIRIQRTGIPLEEWPFLQRATPEDGEWRLLQSCRLIEKKGLDTTLRAFRQITTAYPEARLVIAGDGPQLQALEKLAGDLGITAQVSFPGFLTQDQLRQEVYRSHLFLHPSRTGPDGNREGIPNSLLEAMASGLPVVATRHGGIPEAVTDGESGVLVQENDHDALAAGALRLMGNPEQMTAIAGEARRSIETSFDRARNIQALEQAYQQLMG